eukprot:COSAG05_NODE_8450_length_702_cov_1.270315_2_plen_82_part_01
MDRRSVRAALVYTSVRRIPPGLYRCHSKWRLSPYAKWFEGSAWRRLSDVLLLPPPKPLVLPPAVRPGRAKPASVRRRSLSAA